MIQFIKEEEGIWSVVEINVEIDEWFYTELYYANIDEFGSEARVRFNDTYDVTHWFPSFEAAKKFVEENYTTHKPLENGIKYRLDE